MIECVVLAVTKIGDGFLHLRGLKLRDEVRVYLDMDMVLADFFSGFKKIENLTPEELGRICVDREEGFMRKILRETEHFYDRLDLMPGAIELFNFVWERIGKNCEILTGVPSQGNGNANVVEDKVKWAHSFLNPYVKVNCVLRSEKKKFCTGYNCILVDDMKSNIKSWRKAGGIGILHESVTKSIEELALVLK